VRLCFFFSISTDTSAHIHAHTLIIMNAHTHTLPLWAPLRDWAGISSWDLRSHRRHLVIDGNVSSHWMRIVIKPETNSEINARTRIWILVDWGYHNPFNHPITDWFAAWKDVEKCLRTHVTSVCDVLPNKVVRITILNRIGAPMVGSQIVESSLWGS